MLKLVRVVLFFLVLISPVAVSESSEGVTLEGSLAIAKVTGMCGTFQQMAAFQQSTRLSGGDVFIERFVRTEAARLGMSFEELLDYCDQSVAVYERLLTLFASSE